MTLVKSDIDMYTARQGPPQNITEFMWMFKSMVETVKANGGAPLLNKK